MAAMVIDASAIVAALMPDESTSNPVNIFERASREPFSVPDFWPLEAANAFFVAVRRKRITEEERMDIMRDLGMLKPVLDGETGRRALHDTVTLARRHGLTMYDAAYVELARRIRGPLVTFDRAMIAAARAEGMALIEV